MEKSKGTVGALLIGNLVCRETLQHATFVFSQCCCTKHRVPLTMHALPVNSFPSFTHTRSDKPIQQTLAAPLMVTVKPEKEMTRRARYLSVDFSQFVLGNSLYEDGGSWFEQFKLLVYPDSMEQLWGSATMAGWRADSTAEALGMSRYEQTDGHAEDWTQGRLDVVGCQCCLALGAKCRFLGECFQNSSGIRIEEPLSLPVVQLLSATMAPI